jgi:hypothetical protein
VAATETSSSRSLEFEFLPRLNLLVSYQLETSFSDAEWDAYLAALVRSGPDLVPCLVVTEGSYPTRAQQARLMALVKGRTRCVSVVSQSSGVRFVVSIFALVNRGVKSYSPRDLDGALSHVGVVPTEFAGVHAVVDRLRQLLTSTKPLPARRSLSAPAPDGVE